MAEDLVSSLSIEDSIGSGGFADVYLASSRSGELYAVKGISKEIADIESVKREVEAGHLLNHPNIVKFITYFHDELNYYIVFEYLPGTKNNTDFCINFVGGDLFDFVSATYSLSETAVAKIFIQLVSAVAFCHSVGVVHLDIKLDNIIYNSLTGKASLIDFGLCRFIEGEDSFENIGGSFEYAIKYPIKSYLIRYSPPEVLNEDISISGTKIDVWCLGVVLFAMLTGRFPHNTNVSTSFIYLD
jgi:serine/threonine protein kinase